MPTHLISESTLNHLRQTFILAYRAFRNVVAVQAFIIALYFVWGMPELTVALWLWLGVFACFIVGGVWFGALPLVLGFTPLYAWLSAKGYANWITGLLAGLAIAGVVCLHPKLRLLWYFWMVDGALVGLLTHWAWRANATEQTDELNLRQTSSPP